MIDKNLPRERAFAVAIRRARASKVFILNLEDRGKPAVVIASS